MAPATEVPSATPTTRDPQLVLVTGLEGKGRHALVLGGGGDAWGVVGGEVTSTVSLGSER